MYFDRCYFCKSTNTNSSEFFIDSVSCWGGSDGEATANVVGGTSTGNVYNYTWTDGSGNIARLLQ